MRSDVERLRDILDAIDQIRKHSSKGRAAFERDELIQVWIVHHLARLGEAVARLSPKLRRPRAVAYASDDTRLAIDSLADQPPFTLAEVLGER